MEEEPIILGDPGSNAATGGTQATEATPAGGTGEGADADALDSQQDADDEDGLTQKQKAKLFDALHDPEQAKHVWPLVKDSMGKLGIDLADIIGVKAAEKVEANVEAKEATVDLSGLRFDESGIFDGTEKDLAKALAGSFQAALTAQNQRIAQLEAGLGKHSDLTKLLQPVAERERQKAETRSAINLHGGYVKATVLKQHGVSVNNQDIEKALHDMPAAKGNRELMVAAVVSLKTRKSEPAKGPELLGAGVGAERKDHAHEMDAVVKSTIANLNR